MTAPNMAAITASLERSLQNCSLNHQQQQPTRGGGGGGRIEREGSSSTSDVDAPENHPQNTSAGAGDDDDATLELNSHISLPYHWEQCLDLKTGEIYYINWRNGMRATEDPRTAAASPEYSGGDYYYSEDDSSCDSEESSSESSPQYYNNDSNITTTHNHHRTDQKENVLVVAGCKSCLMYFMVPKHVGDCPKCTGQLLHFDRSDDGSS